MLSLFNYTQSKLISIITTATLGFSQLFFKQSLISEVYSLNSFFVILILYCIVRFLKNYDKRFVFLAFFIGGIGVGNHHTLLGIIFSTFIFLFIKKLDFKTFLISSIFFILGLSVYIYLPLRSLANPILDWGNPENLTNFYNVITRQQFGFGNFNYSIEKIQQQFFYYTSSIYQQFYLPLIIISIIGVYISIRTKFSFFIYLTLIFLINGLFTFFALNPDKNEFFLVQEFVTPSFIISAFYIAEGMNELRNKKPLIYIITVFIVLFTIIYKYSNQRDELSEKNNYFAIQFAKDTLNIIPDKSVIIGETDYSIFPLLYAKTFYNQKDITILDADFFMLPWYQEQNLSKIPFLKEVLPDLSIHTKSKNPDKKIDFEDMEVFKLNQSMELANNIIETLKRPVFFTHEILEIANLYKHTLSGYLKPYGTIYSYKGLEKRDFNFNLDIFLNFINLNDEELFFLKPYVPYLTKESYENYKKNDLVKTEKLFSAIYRIDPTLENALNYGILLSINGKINEAKNLENLLNNSYLKFDSRLALMKGIINFKEKNYDTAFRQLLFALQNPSTACEAKLYIYKTLIRTNNKESANIYYQKIVNECPLYIINRLNYD